MNKEKYEIFLRQTNHTEKSIRSRIRHLEDIEKLLQINIDTIIMNRNEVILILKELKSKDTRNQNLSNALRKYYECMTNDVIEKNILRI